MVLEYSGDQEGDRVVARVVPEMPTHAMMGRHSDDPSERRAPNGSRHSGRRGSGPLDSAALNFKPGRQEDDVDLPVRFDGEKLCFARLMEVEVELNEMRPANESAGLIVLLQSR